MTSLHTWKMLRLAALLTFATAIPTPAQVFTTIASFTSMNGANIALVQGRDGNFYGTQPNYPGSVFRVTPTGDITELHEFDISGYSPLAGLVLATDGRFYGTTSNSATHGSAIFSIASDGAFTTLYHFCPKKYPFCPNGVSPVAALLQADSGQFYGTTEGGGDLTCNAPYGCGTVFKITSSGSLTVDNGSDEHPCLIVSMTGPRRDFTDPS